MWETIYTYRFDTNKITTQIQEDISPNTATRAIFEVILHTRDAVMAMEYRGQNKPDKAR